MGIAKKQKEDIIVSIQYIAPIHSFDSIQTHFLSIILSSLYYNAHTHKPLINLPRQSNRATAPVEVNPPIKLFWEEPPLTLQERRILHLIQQLGIESNEGVSLEKICEEMRRMRMNEQEVEYVSVGGVMYRRTVYQLLGNGHVYNTIDTRHFKPTNLFYCVC